MADPRWCHVCSGTGIGFDGDECLCRIGLIDSYPLNIREHSPNVNYIAVAPDDHAELVRKAAAYDDLKAVIERLDCEIQDLKARFV